jgi:hypothetical protein
MEEKTLQLQAEYTVTLKGAEWGLVAQALSNLPYNRVATLIADIEEQLQRGPRLVHPVQVVP